MPHPSTADELPLWARRTIMWGSAGYAATSITASAFALGHLAIEAGYDDPRFVLFGAAFEVAALVTGTAWAAGPTGSWWETIGRRATLGIFAASLVFNAVEVLQVRALLPAQALVVVAVLVSFAFPVLSLLFGHLYLVAKRALTPVVVAPVADPGSPPEALPGIVAPVAVPEPAAGADVLPVERTRAQLIGDVAAFIAQRRRAGEHYGQRKVAEHFQLSRKDAADIQKAAIARLDTPPVQPARNGARVPVPTAGA